MKWLPGSPEQASRLGIPSLVIQDAGAGNHMRSWMRAWSGVRVHEIDPRISRSRANDPTELERLHECLEGGDWVLVGTGRSPITQTAMRLGKAQGKMVLAVVDHWVNYRERFDLLAASALPDAVLVTDTFALAQVQSELPWATPILWPNQLAVDLEGATQRYEVRARSKLPSKILVLGEPTRGEVEDAENQPEGRFVQSLPDTLGELGIRLHECHVELRLHPSESDYKYERVLQGLNLPLTVVNAAERNITEAIAVADTLIGLTSYALFLGWSVGKPTWSVAESMGLRDPFPPNTVRQLRVHS